VAVWTGLALVVAAGRWRSATNALLLVGAWALLTLVLPSLVQAAIARALPAQQGAALMLAQRQAVHGAWDEPREATLQRFFQSHPAWRDTAPLPQGFHWKWYYAFQQLGDESVAPQVAAYRQSLLARQRWTERAGWLLPSVAVQTALHRVAGTDLPAQLAYQDAIARFHARLREQLYPYLFTDQPYGASDIAQQPRFEPASAGAGVPAHAAALGLLGVVLLVMGDRALRRAARP
jgi:ABC-2 type transport system permease protein